MIFHSQQLNNSINNRHERALKIIYQDYATSVIDLLVKDTPLTIYHKNLQKLVTDMFKIKPGIASGITRVIFQIEHRPYSFRHKFLVKKQPVEIC